MNERKQFTTSVPRQCLIGGINNQWCISTRHSQNVNYLHLYHLNAYSVHNKYFCTAFTMRTFRGGCAVIGKAVPNWSEAPVTRPRPPGTPDFSSGFNQKEAHAVHFLPPSNENHT